MNNTNSSEPTQKRQYRRRSRKKHDWTEAERRLIVSNDHLNPRELKKQLFPSDRTVSEKSVGMQQYNIRNGKVKGFNATAQPSKNGSVQNDQFEIEIAFIGFQEFKKDIKNFNNSVLAKAINHSPYSKTSKEYLLNALENASKMEYQSKQKELVKLIPA